HVGTDVEDGPGRREVDQREEAVQTERLVGSEPCLGQGARDVHRARGPDRDITRGGSPGRGSGQVQCQRPLTAQRVRALDAAYPVAGAEQGALRRRRQPARDSREGSPKAPHPPSVNTIPRRSLPRMSVSPSMETCGPEVRNSASHSSCAWSPRSQAILVIAIGPSTESVPSVQVAGAFIVLQPASAEMRSSSKLSVTCVPV